MYHIWNGFGYIGNKVKRDDDSNNDNDDSKFFCSDVRVEFKQVGDKTHLVGTGYVDDVAVEGKRIKGNILSIVGEIDSDGKYVIQRVYKNNIRSYHYGNYVDGKFYSTRSDAQGIYLERTYTPAPPPRYFRFVTAGDYVRKSERQ